MEGPHCIKSYCTITPHSICLNGEQVFETAAQPFAAFSKSAYQHFGMAYPKFFKMDALSKLAFLGAELLLKPWVDPSKENDIALLLSNRSSSLDTDVHHQESIGAADGYFPSPAVFVYTLPNICLGEISIRHQLKSENSFFIFDAFNPVFMKQYADALIDMQKAAAVLCGWIEYFKEDYRAFLYAVDKTGTWEHTQNNIEKAYNNELWKH